MRVKSLISAVMLFTALSPGLSAAGRKIVVGEYFTATW